MMQADTAQTATSAASAWLDPKVLLGVLLAGVSFIAWLVRLEYKTNANQTRQGEHEEFMDERAGKMEVNLERVKAAHYLHAGDTKVHHNEEAFKEFREGLRERFSTVDAKLAEIKNLIISNNNRDR